MTSPNWYDQEPHKHPTYEAPRFLVTKWQYDNWYKPLQDENNRRRLLSKISERLTNQAKYWS